MPDERNQNQIIRIDARNCFVESLNDRFSIGKAHLTFATYDMNKPSGQRQTNNVHIYIEISELLNLCRCLESGEFRYLLQQRKQTGDNTPLFSCMGGTSAQKLASMGKSRPDGLSLSRMAQISIGKKADLFFSASSEPGQENKTGLIVPQYGPKKKVQPENHVAVSMSLDALSQLLLLTRSHYQAWLTAQYMMNPGWGQNSFSSSAPPAAISSTYDPSYDDPPPGW